MKEIIYYQTLDNKIPYLEWYKSLDNGLRIYYTEAGNTIVLLFTGGNKSKQRKDIDIAKTYLEEYKNRIQTK